MSGRTYVVQGNSVVEPAGAPPTPAPDRNPPDGTGLTELLGTGPLFGVVRRGYDRLAVDAYVESTEEELASLRRKLHVVLRRFHATADALVEARRRPEDHARDIVAQARAEADARMANVLALREAATAARDEARADRARAAAELEAARREAAELVAAAHAAREEAEATAALRLAALESEMADLRRQRDEARAYLRRLTGQIEQALQSLTAVLPENAGTLAAVREPDREALAG
jgi:colicin import membrane protein